MTLKPGEGKGRYLGDLHNGESDEVMMHPIPAPGYQLVSGKRRPPASWGDMLFCQLRMGWCDPMPWPVSTTVWQHTGSAGDVVAVRKP